MRKPINDDDQDFENGILKDKGRYRVDVRLCDAMSRDVAQHAANLTKPTRQHITDAYGNDGLVLNRPGTRVLAGGSARIQQAWNALDRATADAYRLDEHFKKNAWRDEILDVSDDDDAIYEATAEAKSTDCYQEYEAEIRDSWRHGNHE